jgi:transposase
MFLPTSLEELIAVNHLVRVVNKVLDQIDIVPLVASYKAVGTSSFNPRMLLKSICICLHC